MCIFSIQNVCTKCVHQLCPVYKTCKNMYKVHTKWMLWWRFFYKQNRHHRLHMMGCFCHITITKNTENEFFTIHLVYKIIICRAESVYKTYYRCTNNLNVCIMYTFCIQINFTCTYFVYRMCLQNVYTNDVLYTKRAKICTKYIQSGCYGGGFPISKTATIDYT